MRGHKTLIQEAELLAMSPEAVAEFLKQRASQSKDEAREDSVDEKAEHALLSRGHPLVDLALARYARHTSTVATLFQAAHPGQAVRLAALCNTSVSIEIFSHFPVCIFGKEEHVVQWIEKATPEELQALFENPALDDSFLSDLLERRKPWDSITDTSLATIVAILTRNKRMCTPRQDDFMDGYAEYSYGAVFNAAWKLAESVEPTEEWATALGWLYDRLETDAFSISAPLLLAARWQSDASGTDVTKKEADENQNGWLSNKQRVRKGLGRLALRKDSKLLQELLSSGDVALRCAAYAVGRLTSEQLTTAYQRDGELVFNEAMHNTWLWRSASIRAALKDVAWSVVKNDKRSDLMAANVYNSIRKDMLHNHPDWFKDEADALRAFDKSEGPATKADITVLVERIEQQNVSHEQFMVLIRQALQTLNSRAGWVWWFSLGALVASLKHF